MQVNTAILILAAGSSSRMGESKQLLPWGKTTLLGNAIEQALLVKNVAIVVVLGANGEEIENSIESYDVKIVHNENWKRGIGSSISYGVKSILRNYEVSSILIMLGDQPFVKSEYLSKLCETSESHKRKIIVSDYRSNIGVPAVFGADYFSDLTSLNNEKGAKKIIHKYQKSIKVVDFENNLIDVDTEKEYKDLIHSRDMKIRKKKIKKKS